MSDPSSEREALSASQELAQDVALVLQSPAPTPIEVWDVQDRICRLAMAYLSANYQHPGADPLAEVEPLIELYMQTVSWFRSRLPSIS